MYVFNCQNRAIILKVDFQRVKQDGFSGLFSFVLNYFYFALLTFVTQCTVLRLLDFLNC